MLNKPLSVELIQELCAILQPHIGDSPAERQAVVYQTFGAISLWSDMQYSLPPASYTPHVVQMYERYGVHQGVPVLVRLLLGRANYTGSENAEKLRNLARRVEEHYGIVATHDPGKRPLVFLYAGTEEEALAGRLSRMLWKDGFDPWIASQNLLAGETWEQITTKLIRQCDRFVVCLSERTTHRGGFVKRELHWALEQALARSGSTYLVPVVLDRCDMPLCLNEYQSVNLYLLKSRGRVSPTNDGYRELLQGLWREYTPSV